MDENYNEDGLLWVLNSLNLEYTVRLEAMYTDKGMPKNFQEIFTQAMDDGLIEDFMSFNDHRFRLTVMGEAKLNELRGSLNAYQVIFNGQFQQSSDRTIKKPIPVYSSIPLFLGKFQEAKPVKRCNSRIYEIDIANLKE